MRFLAIAFCFLLLQQQHKKTQATQHPTQQEQRGTQESPLVVKVLPAQKDAQETGEETQNRKEKTTSDGNLVNWVLAGIGVLQLFVFGVQALMLNKTVEASAEQGEAMKQHIGEAARSADAMETIATTIGAGNKAIMRAYLSVVIGAAAYQDRPENVKFEGKPNLINTGSTPARNVHVRISAEIVPRADAETFTYALPEEVAKASAVVAPHQTATLSAVVKDFVPDADVADIKQGRGKGALTVWGTITYDDIFGEQHTTKFGQWLFWYPNPNQTVYGYYIPGQNDMD